jgi:hypothetical protein
LIKFLSAVASTHTRTPTYISLEKLELGFGTPEKKFWTSSDYKVCCLTSIRDKVF